MLLPWEQLPEVWRSKAEYFNWLRGQMRKAWSRHPIKVQFKKDKSFLAPKGKLKDKKTGQPKMVKCQECNYCKDTFRDSDTQVDHINPAGSFQNWDDCQKWLMGLMQVNFSCLQILCMDCHANKSYADQYGYSWDEARARKSYIEWERETSIPEQKELLASMGYTDTNNEPNRKAAYIDLYMNS